MRSQHRSLKQLVVLSGKGGTGKTSLTAALMHLAFQSKRDSVFVDADVDAANLALVSDANPLEEHPFTGSQLAVIDPVQCNRSGLCFEVCRYDAILKPEVPCSPYQVIDLLCDGCAACIYSCPESAIQMVQQQDGEWYHSTSAFGHLFHAELFPGAENTGKLVTTVKQHAKLFAEDHQLSLIIVDGPPGIGCPVISASAGADLALLVAEPGVSGHHDLQRIIKTLEHFKIPILVCINKADISYEGTKAIHALARDLGHCVIGEIPFDDAVPLAMVKAQPITTFSPDGPASGAIKNIWQKVQHQLFNESE